MQTSAQNSSDVQFIIGGYYFIQASKLQPWMNAQLLPPFVLSASRCLCEKIPDAWIFPWNTNPDPREDRSKYQRALELSDDEFVELQIQFDKLLKLEGFGYPNVFMNRTLAEDFYVRYFYKLPNVKLISIGLVEKEVQNFIEENKPSKGVEENGVTIKLRQHQIVEEDAKRLGFEVLGYDHADFHSLICGSMEEEVRLKYGVNFNRYGLMDRLEDTLSIVRDIREGVLSAEDGSWASWLVSEYALGLSSE